MLEIIRLNPASSCTDYVMVELQGEVDCHSDKTTTARTIGTMCQAHQTADTLQLTIGHHQLTGKLVDLKKPLVVLQKVSDPHINYQVGTWQTFPPVVFIKEAGDAGTQKSAPFANCSQRKSNLCQVLRQEEDIVMPCHTLLGIICRQLASFAGNTISRRDQGP